MGSEQNGNVFGLKEYFNQFMIDRFITNNYNPVTLIPEELQAFALDPVFDPTANEFSLFDYTLEDHAGGLSLWHLNSAGIVVFEPNDGGLPSLCGGYDRSTYNLYPGATIIQAGWGCVPECNLSLRHVTELPYALMFMTVACAGPGKDVMSSPVDIVVAMGDAAGSTDPATRWGVCLQRFTPDARMWHLETLQEASPYYSAFIAETDPFGEV